MSAASHTLGLRGAQSPRLRPASFPWADRPASPPPLPLHPGPLLPSVSFCSRSPGVAVAAVPSAAFPSHQPLPSVRPAFLRETSEVDRAQAAQAPLTSAAALEAARLTIYVSHFHQVLDLGIIRGDFASGARSYYGRDVTATALPDLTTYEAVALAAGKIGTGEAARQLAEGAAFRPMALPSAAEVSAHLTAFTAARNLAQQAQVKTDRERDDVSALYPAAQALAVDLCDTIEFFYRKDPDDASRRAKCKRWGVVYFYEPNEPQDPEPTPTPAPQP